MRCAECSWGAVVVPTYAVLTAAVLRTRPLNTELGYVRRQLSLWVERLRPGLIPGMKSLHLCLSLAWSLFHYFLCCFREGGSRFAARSLALLC